MRIQHLCPMLLAIALSIATIQWCRIVQAYSGLPSSPYTALIDENPQAGYGLPYNLNLLQAFYNYPGRSYLNQPYGGFGFGPTVGYGWNHGWNQPSLGYGWNQAFYGPRPPNLGWNQSSSYNYGWGYPSNYGLNQPNLLYPWNYSYQPYLGNFSIYSPYGLKDSYLQNLIQPSVQTQPTNLSWDEWLSNPYLQGLIPPPVSPQPRELTWDEMIQEAERYLSLYPSATMEVKYTEANPYEPSIRYIYISIPGTPDWAIYPEGAVLVEGLY